MLPEGALMSVGKFDGKTVLVLGSNVSADDIVAYAKENGAHTIVADYYPPERSIAKRVADEDVLISTADVDALEQLARSKGVDAVFSGISEFNLLRAMELSERLELPFYCTREQWNEVESKESFRRLCMRHSVPCPREYYHGSVLEDCAKAVEAWPIVVKPVDGSASMGVSFCSDETSLETAFQQALAASDKKMVIAEEFVEGNEFTAHYTIHDGKASLSCMDNRYPVTVHDGSVTTVPVARIYPNIHIDKYVDQVNESMVNLIESLGVRQGVLFVQGIYNKDEDRYAVFEAGMRSAGEAPYRFLKDMNGVNYLTSMVDVALLGETDYDSSKEDPGLGGRCAGVISFVALGGRKVGSISGLEEAVAATQSVVSYESRYPIGSVTPDTDTLRQLMIRFVMECDSRDQMSRDIDFLNKSVNVFDAEGRDMVVKMSPSRVFDEG